jgi:rhodanese-related sulfurtransferase
MQPANEGNRTTLGKYISPHDAYGKWLQSPEKVKFLDVRTPDEYYFVGHPGMAVNIPFAFSTGKLDPATQKPVLKPNKSFAADVKNQFKTDDMIVVRCRAGDRAAKAINMLAKEGFQNAYSLLGGFEGDKVKEAGSHYIGKRMKDGWRNAGVPWTYELKEELTYKPAKDKNK